MVYNLIFFERKKTKLVISFAGICVTYYHQSFVTFPHFISVVSYATLSFFLLEKPCNAHTILFLSPVEFIHILGTYRFEMKIFRDLRF